MSTNSYNISHNENCDFYRTNLELTSAINKKSMKKSNTCCEETIKEQADTSLVNSNTIESLTTTANTLQDCTPSSSDLLDHVLSSISNSNQIFDDKNNKNDKNKLNNPNQQIHIKNTKHKIEIRKYDIGQLSDLNSTDSSPGDENEDLFCELNKLNQLQQELQNKTNLESLDFVNNSSIANKKPRPKSDLITCLPNLEEESSNFDWDYGDFKRLSAHDSKSFYSLYFSSPRNLPQNKSTSYINNNHHPVKIRNNGSNGNRKARPKTYHQNLVHYENDDYKDKTISYLNSDLNEINELTPLNGELFITEEEMTFTVEDSPVKSVTTSSNSYKNEFVTDKNQMKANCNNKQSPTKNVNNNSNGTITNNDTTNSNTTTVCSPMSTSSVLGSSISQSLSQSSGYQSFMEDSILENSTVANNIQSENSTNKNPVNNQSNNDQQNSQTNKNSNQIKLRNHPSQLRLGNLNQRTNQRYSCNLPHYGNFNYEQVNDRFNNDKINENENKENIKLNDNNQNNSQIGKSKLSNFNQTICKQLPNPSSNVEISSNQSKTMSCQLPRVESWERKMIVKTFSTNDFNGKDNMYNNAKNLQRISNSFLNLSEKVNSLDLNFLIKKKKDKKKKKGKTDYQFCMLVFGGCEKTNINNASGQPISVWKLYI